MVPNCLKICNSVPLQMTENIICVANNMLSCQSQLLKWTNWWLDVPETDSQVSSENTNLRETPRASKINKKEITSKVHSIPQVTVSVLWHKSPFKESESNESALCDFTKGPTVMSGYGLCSSVQGQNHSTVFSIITNIDCDSLSCSVRPSNSKDSKILFSAQNSKSEAEHRNRNFCLCFEGTKEITKCEFSN